MRYFFQPVWGSDPNEIQSGENAIISISIKNTKNEKVTGQITIFLDKGVFKEITVTLDAGETTTKYEQATGEDDETSDEEVSNSLVLKLIKERMPIIRLLLPVFEKLLDE